jgi:hypothetical protein
VTEREHNVAPSGRHLGHYKMLARQRELDKEVLNQVSEANRVLQATTNGTCMSDLVGRNYKHLDR